MCAAISASAVDLSSCLSLNPGSIVSSFRLPLCPTRNISRYFMSPPCPLPPPRQRLGLHKGGLHVGEVTQLRDHLDVADDPLPVDEDHRPGEERALLLQKARVAAE